MPVIDPYLEEIWEAFNILASERNTGFGVGYIPYSAIIKYLNENGIQEEEERTFYIRLIRHLDGIYVSKCNEEKPKTSKKQPAVSGRRRSR